MKIKSVKISNFKPFQFAGLDNLYLEFDSPIHVILGTNGCGKSFLFNELRFNPTLRSNYESNGYKEIEVEHNGHIYTFGLDNSSSKKYYFFLEDGVELNVSGNESIQEELVEKYLGYTTTTEEIIHYDKPFSNIDMKSRKKFIKDINPCDLSIIEKKRAFVQEKHSGYKQRIKDLKKEISECETQLLSDEEYNRRNKELEDLNTRFYTLSNELAIVNSEIGNIEKEYNKNKDEYCKLLQTDEEPLDISDNSEFVELLTELRKHTYYVEEYFRYNTIEDKKLLEKNSNDAIAKCALYQSKLDGLMDKASSAIEDIKKYEEHLKSTEEQSTLSVLEIELKSIEEELKAFPNTDNVPEIPEHKFSSYESLFEVVREDLETVHSFNLKKIYYPSVIQNIRNKIRYIDSILTNLINEKFSKSEELKKINDQLLNLPSGPSEELPICDSCGYQAIYKTRKQELKDRKNILIKELSIIESKHERYSNAVGNLKVIFEMQNRVNDIINAIMKKLENTIFYPYSKTNFVDTLNKSIINYIKYIDNVISLAPTIYEKRKVLKKYEEKKKQIEDLKNSNTPAKSMLEELIRDKTKAHELVLKDIEECDNKLKEFERIRDKYSRYKRLESRLHTHRQNLEKFAEYLDIVHKLFIRYQYKEQLDINMNEISKKITEVRAILHDQNHFKIKYQERVEELKIKTHEFEITTELMKALSIETGYPQKIIIDYINSIIKNVNYIINTVWTYPIKVQELSIEDKFDGKIPVQIESIIVPDIKSLSKGQKSIVDFAFNLAIMISSKLTNYPLFLDEITNGSFSELHKEKLLSWMRTIIDEKYASQLFVIDHDAYVNNGFRDATMICMKDDGSFNKDNAASKFIKYIQ